MRRARAIAFASVLTMALPASPDVPVPAALQVLGSVTNAARPVANALVIALNLTSFEAIQTYTSTDGSFKLPPLQTGIYKVIAVKYGFAPAIATVVPGQPNQRVNLKMQDEKPANGRQKVNQELWELRGSMPADVLRELDFAMAAPQQQSASYDMPRFRGEMVSMTGVASENAAHFAQTGVGVHSRLGETWQIGIRGDMQRIDDPSDSKSVGSPAAEAAVMEMELRSSPNNAYRVATTQSSWRYRETAEDQAELRSHNFEWLRGDAHLKVRYLEQDNVFGTAGSDVFEIAGATNIISTRRNDFGVSLRVRQESVRSSANMDPMRTASLSARGSVEVVPAFAIEYGVSSRLGLDRTEWAPRTGFQWRVDKNTALVASVEYKLLDQATSAGALLPSLVVWSDDQSLLPRYSYSFGFVQDQDEHNQFSAIATVTAADAPLRVVFDDGSSQFWDGLYIDSGDIRRDIRLTWRHDFGPRLAVDVATTAGTATPRQYSNSIAKAYVIGDVQTIFVPTGTTLAISYREIRQPQVNDAPQYHSARMNARIAQSLYLPIDVKLLLGVELARVENSPFLLDPMLGADETARRYVGGLALNF